MLHPQPVLASDANFYDALDDADDDNVCSRPDICQQLLTVAALVDGAPQPGAHDFGRPNMLSPISSAPFTVGVTASSLGSSLDYVKRTVQTPHLYTSIYSIIRINLTLS